MQIKELQQVVLSQEEHIRSLSFQCQQQQYFISTKFNMAEFGFKYQNDSKSDNLHGPKGSHVFASSNTSIGNDVTLDIDNSN